jgi:hypothetical protein
MTGRAPRKAPAGRLRPARSPPASIRRGQSDCQRRWTGATRAQTRPTSPPKGLLPVPEPGDVGEGHSAQRVGNQPMETARGRPRGARPVGVIRRARREDPRLPDQTTQPERHAEQRQPGSKRLHERRPIWHGTVRCARTPAGRSARGQRRDCPIRQGDAKDKGPLRDMSIIG